MSDHTAEKDAPHGYPCCSHCLGAGQGGHGQPCDNDGCPGNAPGVLVGGMWVIPPEVPAPSREADQ